MALQEDGKIIIGSSCSSVNDLPLGGLVRLNQNGVADPTWTATTYGPTNSLAALAVGATNIYVGAFDLNINGVFRYGVMRLNALDGSVDTNWNPNVANNGLVAAIAVSGSNVIVGGSFSGVGGLPIAHLAKLSALGTGEPDNAWNPAPNFQVQSLALSGTNVFTGGVFTSIGGASRSGLAKLSATSSSTDTSWNPVLAGFPLLPSVPTLAVKGTNLYVAGNFTSINNVSRNGLAKLNTEGAGELDLNWNPAIPAGSTINALAVIGDALFIGGVLSDARPFLIKADAGGTGLLDSNWVASVNLTNAVNLGGDLRCLAGTPTKLYAGGRFAKVGTDGNASVATLGYCRLDAVSGQRDDSLFVQVQYAGIANAVVRQSDGRLVVGGRFESAGGLKRANLVRVSADGQVDPTWSPDTDGEVTALALSGTDLFVGGRFKNIGGASRTNLAKIAILGSDAADSTWNVSITNTFNDIRALSVSGTNLYVGGGGLGRIGGLVRNGLVKLSIVGSGAGDATWTADTTDQYVLALAIEGTNLFVGGTFSGINGVSQSSLAKISAVGSGVLDTIWSPAILPLNFPRPPVNALAINETNLFIGGSFTTVNGQPRRSLAKLSKSGVAQLDSTWAPVVNNVFGFEQVWSLALNANDLYVGGNFTGVAGINRTNVAQVSAQGTGTVNTAFSPNPSGVVKALLAQRNDLYAAGQFGEFYGAVRNGFALQSVADAPVLIQDSATNLFIFRNPLDGPGVTHFRIVSTGINSPPLYLSDGTTLVHDGDFITVAEGSAGLIFAQNGVVTVASAVNPTPEGTGAATSTLTMGATAPPFLTFTSPSYSVREGQGNVVATVRKFGSGAASVGYTTVDQTATGGVDHQTKSGTLNFSAADRFKNVIITIADDLESEGDEQFGIILSTNANNNPPTPVTLATTTVTIVDNDIVGSADSVTTTLAPTNLPPSTGALTVVLEPANGQWRLQGGLSWHASGESVKGLLADDYRVEFRPLHGYKELEATTVQVLTGITNYLTKSYESKPPVSEVGGFRAIIQPSSVTNGRWRLQEGPAGWFISGEDITVSAGTYTLEFTNLPGLVTPPEQTVEVRAGERLAVTGFYLESPSGVVPPPYVDFPGSATNEPFCYNGQLQTSVGFGSGFVVQPRVVLTAAHVLFDDYSLTPATDVRWFFQRYRDQFEPVPQTPRGWYVFTGYAAQRTNDMSQGVTPGYSSLESQPLDAAAMYFLEDAGRNGCYGGFLSTDADANEFLLSANNKFLAGYPLAGVALANQGKLHATDPANLLFTRLQNGIFSTTNIQGLPGNSGGPLYVQTDTGKYLPAAIFLGGSGETLVRPINSEVVDLINRADRSSHGGGNSTGGGVTIISIYTTVLPESRGQITINLVPPDAIHIRPGWRFAGSTGDYYTNATITLTLTAGSSFPITYRIEFKPVPGFIAPEVYSIELLKNQGIIYEAKYDPVPPLLDFHSTNGLSLAGCSNATYRIESTTNLASAPWETLTNVTLSSDTLTLPGTQPAASGSLFYRAALVP